MVLKTPKIFSTEENEMKIYLGLNAIVFVSLNLIAWPVCWAAPPEPGDYRVYDATGGHMQKDDEFTLS